MKTKNTLLAFLFHASALCVAPLAHAATYYWDTDGATAGAGGATPTEDWITAGSTWSTSANGSAAVSAVTTSAADDLIFSAGINATGSYTVGLSDTQLAKSLTFRSGTVTISGTGGIDLGGTGIMNVTTNLATTPLSASIGAGTDTVLAGTVGLTKIGVGTLTLNGSAVHTLTGGLRINGGTLALNYSNLTTPTNLINSGNALSFGGGALSVTGKPTESTAQTFGNVTVNSGGGSLLVNPNDSSDTTVSLGSLTTTASGGSFIVGQALSSGTGLLAITTTTDKDATGIYGGRVVYANGTANTGYDWATTEDLASPFTLSAYADYAPLDTITAEDVTDTFNSVLTGSATLPAASNRTTNSLKFQNPAGGSTFAIGTGNTLTLTSGGLLITGSNTNINITGGNITAGDGTAPADLVVHQFNPSQPLGVGITGGSLNNTPEIFANITNNGSQPVTLVKNGPGSIRFMGTNTFTGGVIVNQGSLEFGTNALNNNPITFNANAFLYTNGAQVSSGSITLNNNAQVTVCNNNSSFTVNATVTGTGGIGAANGGQGAMTLNLNSTENNFTGPVRFLHSNGTQPCTISVASLPDTDTFGTGNITFGGGTVSSTSQTFTYGSGAIAPLELTNRRIELAGENVNQFLVNNSAQELTISNDLLVTGNRAKNLTLAGTGAGLSTFAGVIANHPSPSAPGIVPNSIRRTANGNTLILGSVEGITVGSAITGSILTAGTTITAVNPFTREVTLSNSYTGGNNSNFNTGVLFTVANVVNSVSLTKSNSGTWVLSGNNSYTGPTHITAGNLRLQHANALGGTGIGTLVAGGGTVQLIGGISYAAEPLTLTNNTGNVSLLTNLSDDNTWNGPITTTGNTSGSLTRIQSDADLLTLAGTIDTSTNNNSAVVLQGAGNITVTGQITGSAGVTGGSVGAGPDVVRTLSNDANDFTGRLAVSGAVLAFTSVADAGTPSALGAGTSVPTIGLAFSTTDATLRYIGTAPGGHSSNRAINLGSGTAGDNTATIEANGAGPLTLGTVSANTSGTRALVLSGTNTAVNSIGAITTGSATEINVTKEGTGTWALTGVNDYLGNTTINEGTLALSGASLTSPISVAAGASLGFTIGSPTSSSNTTVDLTAGTVRIIGTPTLASYTLMTTAGITGTPTLAAPVPGYALVLDGTTLKLESMGGDMTPPTLVSITDNVAGGPVNIGDTITYTVTFNEDINEASVTAADFDNNGTAGITVGAITETSPGVFTVAVTVNSPGSVKLRIPTGAVIEDVALNDLVVPVEDDTTITVRNAYQTWALTNAISSAPAQDKDGDGVNNAVEFVLGGTVGGNDIGKLPSVSTTATNMIFTFQRKRSSIDGITGLKVEVGTTLSSWTTEYTVGTTTGNSSPGVVVAENTPSGFDTITVTVSKGTDPSKFARLKATVTE